MAWVCKSEDKLLESVLSFHQWGPSGLAQVTSLGIKYPYLLSHLAASPFIYIYIDVYLFACTLSFKSFFAGACVVCTFVCVCMRTYTFRNSLLREQTHSCNCGINLWVRAEPWFPIDLLKGQHLTFAAGSNTWTLGGTFKPRQSPSEIYFYNWKRESILIPLNGSPQESLCSSVLL